MKKLLTATFALLLAHSALAGVKIEHWVSPSGAKVYFVESRVLPMLDVQVDFVAGSMFDPAGKSGVAALTRGSLDLGAGHFRTMMLVVVPLALPGILSGVLITFIPALGAYLTPDLLGGPDSQMIANVIERQFKRANDWPFGAALSFLLLYLTFVMVAVQALIQRRRGAR